MDQIVQGAVAGMVVGLLTTAIPGIARSIRQSRSRRRDIRHIRKIVEDAIKIFTRLAELRWLKVDPPKRPGSIRREVRD